MRNFGLDVFRAGAIWMVLLMHLGFKSSYLMPQGLGGYGVEFFFVLSGFLIGGILFKQMAEASTFRSVAVFWVKRWFRILPLYYLCLLIRYFTHDHELGWNMMYYVFFLQNHFYGISFYSVTWSLVIEEWFYVFSPLYILGVLKLFKSKKNAIAWSLVVLVLLVVGLRFVYWFTQGGGFYAVYGNVPLRFDTLFVGVFLAWIKRSNPSFYSKLAGGKVFSLSAAALVVLVVLNANAFATKHPILEGVSLTMGFLLFSVGVAGLIPYVEQIELKKNGFLTRNLYRFVTLTSLLTYALYLLHPIVFEMMRPWLKGIESRWLVQIMLIGITYLVAYLIYRFYERPFLFLRDRLFNEERKDKKYMVS
jgi:peptidoglycan/LPS O-acetylase OafA/YrhL